MSYADLPDEALIRRIAQSDRDALAALYDRYGRRVFALAARMLGDRESSEEVTQDVFLSVWRRVSSYQASKSRFTTWLFSIAHNRTIDELRRRMRDHNRDNVSIDWHLNRASNETLPADEVIARSEFEIVSQALATLPPEQRRVVQMSYFGGYTQAEIARMTGQPLGTVKTRMRLALKKLRAALAGRLSAY